MAKTTLYGFDGSTYVRTIKILLDRKNEDFDQVQVNVLEGEPKQPEHLERHPLGKVPVLDTDGHRIRETTAIAMYLEETREGPSALPESAWDRARMYEIMSIVNSYGYDALVGTAFYHIMPEFIGNPSEAQHHETVERAKTILKLIDDIRGGDAWLAGSSISLADYWLGPVMFYAGLTPHKDELLGVGGMQGWWDRLSDDQAFAKTEPNLG